MSSRLFQRVREELGLAYAVYTFQGFYTSAGVAGAYVGTRPGWEERVLDAMRTEYARVATEGLPAAELERAKRQIKGQITLSLESTGARLHRVAAAALNEEPFLSVDELHGRIDAVSVDDIADLGAAFFDPDRQVVMRLGPA